MALWKPWFLSHLSVVICIVWCSLGNLKMKRDANLVCWVLWRKDGQLWKIASCSRARVGTLSERSDSKWAQWAVRTWLTPQNSVHTTQKQLDNMHGQSWLVPGLGQLCILSWAKGDATGDRINTVTTAAPLQCITVYFSVGRQKLRIHSTLYGSSSPVLYIFL